MAGRGKGGKETDSKILIVLIIFLKNVLRGHGLKRIFRLVFVLRTTQFFCTKF